MSIHSNVFQSGTTVVGERLIGTSTHIKRGFAKINYTTIPNAALKTNKKTNKLTTTII